MNDNKDKFALKGMLYVHNAIRRDIDLLDKKINSNNLNSQDLSVILNWFKKYHKMIDLHHDSEEKIFFPVLANKNIEIKNLVTELKKEHISTDLLFEGIYKELESGVITQKLKDNVRNLKNDLFGHAGIEEEKLIPFVSKTFTEKEQKNLENRLHHHINIFYISYLIPWMIDSMEKKDFEIFYKSLPEPIKFLWKNFWRKSFEKIQSKIYST